MSDIQFLADGTPVQVVEPKRFLNGGALATFIAGVMFMVFGLIIILIIFLSPARQNPDYIVTGKDLTASAIGVVTENEFLSKFDHVDGISIAQCAVKYTFSVDGEEFSGPDTRNFDNQYDCRKFPVGDKLTVYYQPSNPLHNSNSMAASIEFVFTAALVPLIMGAVAVAWSLIWSIYKRRRDDVDNDGIPDDGMPAGKALREQALRIMQNQGIFISPTAKMTQGEARKIIREAGDKIEHKGAK